VRVGDHDVDRTGGSAPVRACKKDPTFYQWWVSYWRSKTFWRKTGPDGPAFDRK
jgi:hypothetical protein